MNTTLKVCGISDIHYQHRTLDMPEADILVVAGDYLAYGYFHELFEFNEWLGLIKHKYPCGIFVMNGNHEVSLEGEEGEVSEVLTNATFVQDELVIVKGKRIYFTPWVPRYGDWAYMKTEEELVGIYSKIPEGLDLLVNHGMPRFCLDRVMNGNRAGSLAMRNWLMTMTAPPKHYFGGHLHAFEDNSGRIVNKEFYIEFGCKFYNLSIMSEWYSPDFKPTWIEI